ncbi:MAG: DUF4265 domain-containing protein [Sphingobacteriales bacterium]|nr:MAG: DUF4265 domain-containing protein [Sphingobacteriales bacterium]
MVVQQDVYQLRWQPPVNAGVRLFVNTPSSPNSKVLFRVPEDDGTAQVETLWATALGDDQYKLDSSPFYAYSVSWEDIVRATR